MEMMQPIPENEESNEIPFEEYFYGEWVTYQNASEKNEAYTYLLLWKKYLLRKIPEMKFVNEQWIENKLGDDLTLALKIQMRLYPNDAAEPLQETA